MCNHWPLNVNSKKYRPVLERRGQINSAAICLNTVKDLLPIPLAKRMKNRVPQGSMTPQYRTLKIPLKKKFNTAILWTHMSPLPPKLSWVKFLTYTSSVTIRKKKMTKIGFLFSQNACLKQKGIYFIEVVGWRSSTIWQDCGNDLPIHVLLLWNLYEGGATVCGDTVLLDFAAVFQEFLL